MSVRSFAPGKEIVEPRGMWSVAAQKRKGSPQRASFSQNARVAPGIVGSRPGTSAVVASTGKVSGLLFNWVTPTGSNIVLFLDNGVLRVYPQGGSASNLLTGLSTTRAPVFADLDVWAYITGYDTSGNGTMQVQIYDGTNLDKAFRAPITLTAATATDGGTGYCTEGTHFIGFVYQNRTGFAGVPTTKVSGTAISVTLNAGLRQINVSVTLPALADGGGNAALFLLMTRADNPNLWYFMPTDSQTGAIGEVAVPLNTPATLNFVANLSDEDMADELAGDTASQNFLLLTQDGSGNGPFNPSFVVPYGTRMCYGVGPNVYISDQNDPQHLTGDQHVVTTPNRRNVAFAFPVPGGTDLYLTGDRWTSRVSDNQDVPATWATPIQVSDALGAPFPSCVCYRTRGNYAWIATEGGVYRFFGEYEERPVTYLVGDQWTRVNWTAAYSIIVVDDVVNLRLYVAVPLDGATEPNGLFVIDYTNGLTFDQVDISLDIFNPASFSGLGVVKEAATDISNIWIGPSAAGHIAHFDSTTRNDQGHAINSFWESGLIRGVSDFNSRMIRVGALDIWVRGNGTLLTTVYGPDKTTSVMPTLLTASGVPATLSPEPGTMYQEKLDLARIENYTVQIGTNAVDAWWELSEIVGYAKNDLYNK